MINVIKSVGLASRAYDEGSIPFTRSIKISLLQKGARKGAPRDRLLLNLDRRPVAQRDLGHAQGTSVAAHPGCGLPSPASAVGRSAMAAAGPNIRRQAPASTAVTALFRSSEERMISFSSSTRRKNTKPPSSNHGQTRSGTASLSKRYCSGGA